MNNHDCNDNTNFCMCYMLASLFLFPVFCFKEGETTEGRGQGSDFATVIRQWSVDCV
jgi:hypothetical protein